MRIRSCAVALLALTACSGDGADDATTAPTSGDVTTTDMSTPIVSTGPPATTVGPGATAPVSVIDDTQAVGGTRLYTVDLTTGVATAQGSVGAEIGVLGLAAGPEATLAYGITDRPDLITFDPANPATITSRVPVTGVEGSTVLAIDLRPADGLLVGVTDAGTMYTIDPGSGTATPIGVVTAAPLIDPGIGVDVDPATGRVEVAAASGERFSTDPTAARPTLLPAPTYDPADPQAAAPPRIVAIGTGGPDGRYAVDAETASLVVVDDGGVLRTVGPLGVTFTDGASFDIGPSGVALFTSPG